MEMTDKRHKEIIKELTAKENKTDEEIFYLVCEFIRRKEFQAQDSSYKAAAWNQLVEYLDNEGFEITK